MNRAASSARPDPETRADRADHEALRLWLRMLAATHTVEAVVRRRLHAEFGTKDDLGKALVMRETAEFFDGVMTRLGEHPGDLAGELRWHFEIQPEIGTVFFQTMQRAGGVHMPLHEMPPEPRADSERTLKIHG